MTNLQKGLIASAAVVVVAGIVAASIFSKPSAKGEEVYYAKAAKRDLSAAVTATGKIEARTKVNVQSSVMGEIVDLPVKEGTVVRKGDLLVQVDPALYRQEVERLDALVHVQTIAIEQAESTLENARRVLQRNTELFNQGGYVSKEILEARELDVRSQEINLKSLKQQVAQAAAALAKARTDLSKTTIRSPIDGLVTQLNAEKGEITLTGTMNNPGTVIMVVSDMGEILATVDVDETRVVQVHPGQPARVVVDAVGEAHPYHGKVSEIAGTGTKRAGQDVQVFPVKIALDEVDAKLRPSMTAKARIETSQATNAVTVPLQAVILRPRRELAEGKGGGKPSPNPAASPSPRPSPSPSASPSSTAAGDENVEAVFKVVDGKAVLTAVKTGISDETSVVVTEGIAEGDTVVTGPYRQVKTLKNGDAVRERTEKSKDKDSESES